MQVRHGEWGLMGLALFFAFGSVAETALIRIYVDAILLSGFDASYLPAYFIVYNLLFMVASIFYATALGRVSAVALNGWLLASLAAVSLASPIFIPMFGKPFVFGLCLVLTVAAPLARILCWNAITECFDTRQSKRLLPLAGAGSTVGAIVASFAAAPFVRVAGVDALLLVIGTVFAGMAVMPHLLARQALQVSSLVPSALRASATIEVTKEGYLKAMALGLGTLRRNKLVGTVGAMLLLGAVTAILLEYCFKTSLQDRFSKDEMAIFLGHFQGYVNAAILFLQLFVVGRVLGSFSIRFVFGLLPAVLLAGAAVMVVDPAFWVIVALCGAELLLRYTFQNSAAEMVLSPVPVMERNRAKVVMKGVMVPLGGLIGGVLLVGVRFAYLGHDDAWRALAWICLACLVWWLYRVLRVKRFYLDELRGAVGMGRMVLSPSAEVRSVLEGDTLRELLARLEQSDPTSVDFFVDLLGRDASGLSDASAVLQHPSPRVRAAVLRAIATHHLTRQRRHVVELLAREEHPDVLRAGLSALRMLGEREHAEAAERLADHPELPVRAEALALLFQSGGAAGRARARQVAEEWIRGTTQERRAAAYLIGEMGGDPYSEHEEPEAPPEVTAVGLAPVARSEAYERGPAPWDIAALGELLGDRQAEVRIAAYRAVGRAKVQVYLPRLVQALISREEARSAAEALQQLGAHAVQALVRAYRGRASPRRLRLRIVQTLGGLPVAASVLALMELLRDGDAEARRIALRSLHRLRSAVSPRAYVRERFEEALAREVRLGHLCVGLIEESRRAGVSPFFIDELERRLHGTGEAIFDLLGLLYDTRTMRTLHRRFRMGIRPVRANVVELLENIVDPDLRGPLVRFLEDTPTVEREARARSAWALGADGSFTATLLENTDDRWLQRCLFYVSGPELRVRFPSRVREVSEMVPLMEKVILLKAVPLFAELSGETLYPIAEIADDVQVPMGTVIFEQGDVGNYLYVVVSGAVEIQRAGQVVSSSGPREAFGEMAVLDDRPRSATAVALEDTQLLRIAGEPFGDLLDQHPEISRGIIRVLLSYVRGAAPRMPA